MSDARNGYVLMELIEEYLLNWLVVLPFFELDYLVLYRDNLHRELAFALITFQFPLER